MEVDGRLVIGDVLEPTVVPGLQVDHGQSV